MNYPNKYDITKLQLLHAYMHMDVLVVTFHFFKTSKFPTTNTICCVKLFVGTFMLWPNYNQHTM